MSTSSRRAFSGPRRTSMLPSTRRLSRYPTYKWSRLCRYSMRGEDCKNERVILINEHHFVFSSRWDQEVTWRRGSPGNTTTGTWPMKVTNVCCWRMRVVTGKFWQTFWRGHYGYVPSASQCSILHKAIVSEAGTYKTSYRSNFKGTELSSIERSSIYTEKLKMCPGNRYVSD